MRRILIGLAFMLAALPAWAQTRDENWTNCHSGNPDTDIQACTAIIQSGQETAVNQAIAYRNRAWAYGQKGLYEREIADATQAIALQPDFATAYNSRAWAYHLMGKDAQGLPDVNKAVTLAPNDGDFVETRAEIYEKLGQRDAAIADYRATLKLAAPGSAAQQAAQSGMARLGARP